jgi:hypothetical protein
LIAGKGGKGADVNGTATAGGPAIALYDNVRLSNTGVIGGGGGGGNWVQDINAKASGGGGAGFQNGLGGSGEVGSISITPSEDGSNQLGGDGGRARGTSGGEPSLADGGAGGNLGGAGQFGGGAAGAAIALNGYTITYINTGTILGTVS